MTPEERDLIADLFARLAQLERNPRDAAAERAIGEGLRRAPNAIYALVQTVLVQDEALRAANDHIADLEDELSRTAPAAAGGERPRGFLDGMRDTLFGRDEARHGGGGSVPPVGRGQPMGAPRGYGGGGDAWGGGREAAPGYGNAGPGGPGGGPGAGGAGGPGGGFLGTAAAVAAGAIGGSLLMGGIRSALGSQSGQSGAGGAGGGPFGGVFDQLVRGAGGSGGSSRVDPNSSLAQDAGLGDVARGGRSSFANTAESDPRKEREQPADDDEDDENDGDEDDDDLEDDYEDEDGDDYDDGDDDE